MKKTGMKVLAGTLAIALTIAVAPAPGAQAAKKVSLNKKKLTITVGKSKQLKLKNNKKKVTWKITSGKNCIKLKAKKKTGVTIVAKKKGTAKVQAKIGKKKYTCKVTVKAAQVAATKKPVATVAATVAPTPTPTPTLAPTPEPTPTLEPTPTPEQTEDPAEDLNSADVSALRTFIETLKEAGATVSEDIQDAEQYAWDEDGYLESINWRGVTISGELKFPAFENIWDVNVSYTDITALDVSACSTLECLDCDNCENLVTLNVSGCDWLEELYCQGTALTSLDLSACPYLYEDSASLYLPEDIEVTWWAPLEEEILALETLVNSLIENGAPADIAVRNGNGELNENCYEWDAEGRVEAIDWSGCSIQGEVSLTEFTNLIYVDVNDNAITSLDLSGCSALMILDCADNDTLTSLKLTGCRALEYLDCSGCDLTELDLSDCVLLDVSPNTENFLYDNGVQITTPEGDLGGNTFDPEE